MFQHRNIHKCTWALSDDEEINRAWENIKENIKTSAKENLVLHELKQQKP